MPSSANRAGDDFIGSVPERIEALRDMVGREPRDLLPLDLTYGSLDRLEDFFATYLSGDGAHFELQQAVTAYVGETLAANTTGRWDPPRTRDDLGAACITGLPALRTERFHPLDVVSNYERLRTPGYLRDATELYDIPLRRRELVGLLNRGPEVLAGLSTLAGELLNTAPIELDDGEEALAAVEEAIKRFRVLPPSRDALRRLNTALTLYLGQRVQRAVGGEWAVCNVARHGDIGQFTISGWAPLSVVRNVGPNSRPGLLNDVIQLVIRGRAGQGPPG